MTYEIRECTYDKSVFALYRRLTLVTTDSKGKKIVELLARDIVKKTDKLLSFPKP